MKRIYITVFAALVILTAVTVTASRIDLGREGNIILAILIAAFKASLVALFFMHLKYDGKMDKIFYAVAFFPLILFTILTLAIIPDIGARLGQPEKGAETQTTTEVHK